jgi:hypothetical protein
MSDFNEQYFSRLRKDKDFANEVLLYKSHELLKIAFDLYLKEPDRMNEIINSIGYSIDKHLNTKNKLKVIHVISKEMGSLQVIGLRNLYFIGNTKITEFNKKLYNTLQWIEDKEEGKIQERDDILKALQQKQKNIFTDTSLTGFQSTLADEKVELLYNQLLDKYIDKETKLDYFKAIFKNDSLPDGFKPVKWIFQNKKKQPHKTALREFLALALGKSPDQKTINICFTDRKGGKIQLAKPKKDLYTDYWAKKFRTMISH